MAKRWLTAGPIPRPLLALLAVRVLAKPTRPGRVLLRAYPKLKLRLDLYT